jgi:hypothetical protein
MHVAATATRNLRTRPLDDRGGVLVIVAVWLTSALALITLVVDVGNWFVHKRHLQTQADAAALAGGDSFSLPGCSNTVIESSTRNYGGPHETLPSALYNAQVGGTPADKLHLLINSNDYWDPNASGNQNFTLGQPCDPSVEFIDVKLTEEGNSVLSFFSSLLPKAQAHARVTIKAQVASGGALPIAVPNPLPKSAGVMFVNEANNNSRIAAAPLSELPPDGSNLDKWSSAATSVTIPAAATGGSSRTGVIVALSGLDPTVFSTAGDLATFCGQALTECYDATNDPPTQGLDLIRGWSSSGSGAQPNAPLLRDVELFANGCTDGYFLSDATNCSVRIEARIDAGGLSTSSMIITANGQTLTADSSTSTECQALEGTAQCWRGTIPITAASGANPITMTWEETAGAQGGNTCSTRGGNKCKGNFEGSQTIVRPHAASTDTSGPIKAVQIYDCGGGAGCTTYGLQSFQIGSSQSLSVKIAIAGALKNATSVNDPLVALRVRGKATQSLDCDPNLTNLKAELAQGCGPAYKQNDGTPQWDCSSIGTAALWNKPNPPPWECIAVTTGAQPNDVSAGLNQRILLNDKANKCPAAGENGHNNWSMFDPTKPNDGFIPGDRRILQAFLTTYGALSHVNGTSRSIPVTDFATFYVTGWTGQGGGFDNPCQKPGGGDDPVPNNDPGLIVGHFIKYVNSLNTTDNTGSPMCNQNSFGACVAVLTQ